MSHGHAMRAVGPLIALGSVVVMMVLFLLAELTARWIIPERCAQTRGESERVAMSRGFLAPCFVREPRGGTTYLVAPASGDTARGAALPEARTAGVLRIAIVGESSADLLAKHLAELLEGRCPRSVEVLNCAQPGSALEHVERRFDEVLAYAPDAVVVLFGHNVAFRFPVDETTLRLLAARTRSCLLSQLAPSSPAPDEPLDVRVGAFAAFLRQAAARAREHGAALAVATMPANLWLPPATRREDEYDPRFLQARFLDARGHTAEAIRLLETLAAHGDQSYWHYQLGERLARAGDDAGAARELQRAIERDGMRTRAPRRVNDMIRAVAHDDGLLLLDTERTVASHAPQGLPGWESFADNCHLLPAALDAEADALLALLGDAIHLPPACAGSSRTAARKGLGDVLVGVFDLAAMGPPELARAWYGGLSLAVESWISRDPAGAEADVDRFLQSPAFTAARSEDRGAAMLVALAEGYQRAGLRERASELNRQARDSGSAEAWVQAGLFHVRDGDDAAARAAFQRALALDGTRADARAFLGWLD